MTLTAVSGFEVGHALTPNGKSGCTVVLGSFRSAVEIRGMATGTRELGVLSPDHLVERIDALLLTGGSAFGLSAADGVMAWLAEQGRGFDTGAGKVPLVPAAVIFDLVTGGSTPGPVEGREAAEMATGGPVEEGRVGAGAGATVGKLLGPAGASAGGIGSASRPWGGGFVGALAVVNALGEVRSRDGEILAGARGPEGEFVPCDVLALQADEVGAGLPGTNTTLAVVGTDLPLSRVDLGRVAKMAATAFPKAISPVNTPFDGDLVFALSSAAETRAFRSEEILALGVAARDLVEESIRRAVTNASALGLNGPESGNDGHGPATIKGRS
jgi:L-aminopeptidase/D-esterase-like protein